MNKLDMESKDIVDENIQKISELFPNVIVESDTGKTIDFDMLKQELSKDIVEGVKEKYQLTWPGKKEAIVNANIPSKSTLRPLKEKSVDFDNTQNIYIEGDNLEVLKILQESYLNKIKCIYIDPPYNTGNDFIYNDKFKKDIDEELLESGQVDEEGNRMVTNNQSNGRFHSDWLSMMYPRLKLARNLLTDDGVIFISIDDNEIDNLKKICDEIFGENNFVATFIWKKTSNPNSTSNNIGIEHEYIILYSKNYNYKLNFLPLKDFDLNKYINLDEFELTRGKYKLVGLNKTGTVNDLRPNLMYDIVAPDGAIIKPRPRWRWSKEMFENGIKEKRIVFKENNGKWTVYYKQYLNEDNKGKAIERGNLIKTILDDSGRTTDGTLEVNNLLGKGYFDFPKPSTLIKKIIYISTNCDDIVLDFFSGSATTAHAVMQLNSEDNGNRKYIMVQLPEKCEENSEAYRNGYKTICEIGEERIRRAGAKIKEETNVDIDYGFRVYKTDTTNMKDVYYIPDDLEQGDLLEFESNIKEDRTTDDLLTQVILDLGLSLDLNIEEKMIGKNKVYYVAGNSLVACFDDKIDIDIVDKICECEPYKVVFKDSAFRTDNDKINLEERFKKLLPQRANDSGFINIL